ncbi:MAG TPA: glycosyltransferase family 9 protein [Chlamydiales bacterium]|nr:glycosyltransferase family 9 protein [Chlamydiales bacterium]
MHTRAGVFCHNGLGDGVNCLVLSHNLHLNGWEVETFQNTIGSMQEWFPHLHLQPYPDLSCLPKILNSYDRFFVVQNDTSEFVLKLIQEGKRRFPNKLKVIYLYPSKHIVNEPYYSDCLIQPHLSIAENLFLFCQNILHLPQLTKSNGFIAPSDLISRKHSRRIVVHPTSARESRNWPKEKFVKLALHLKRKGYEPVFVPGGLKEKNGWKDVENLGFQIPVFSTLNLLARFIYESGYLIGNDSGLGHLASALGVPTLTFCRRKKWADMWAPSFTKGVVVCPHSLIPNIRGARIRDRYWKKWITVNMAKRGFDQLYSSIN